MPLSIDQLAAFGFSHQTLNAWRSRGITHLLPLQEKTLAEHGFLHGRNLLVFAPTSSGKTFVAEMAILRHLEQNKRAVYLVPTKALAEEKFEEFSSLYAPLGYRIAISTRERPETDKIVMEGQYDLLIAVYEKMKAYLVSKPEMLSSIALVVADEIQMLGETGRGGTIDLLLTKIAASPYATQILGLSAVLGDDAQRLAGWLGSELMVYRARPVEMREGIFDASSGLFLYREFNTADYGEEQLIPPDNLSSFSGNSDAESDWRRDIVLGIARHLSMQCGEQVIVFVPTRYASRNWAHHLASRLDLSPASSAIDEIQDYEETHSRELLMEALQHGIAFHNSDLSWDLRELIESYFNDGSIRVLISTSTLGQGVNLTGRNVIHVPIMVANDTWTGQQNMISLSRGRFRNQGGRAARFTHESDFGRSILVALNAAEAQRLMHDYIEGDIENLAPQLSPESLDLETLDLIASRVAPSHASAAEFFFNTFSGRTLWQKDSARAIKQINEGIERLLQRQLIIKHAEDRLEPTGIGEVAAATGLQLDTIGQITQWLREEQGGRRGALDDPLEALVIFAATPDARDFPLGAYGIEHSAGTLVEALRERLLNSGKNPGPSIEKLLLPAGGLTRQSLLDFRKALLLDKWIGSEDTRDIEEQFQAFSGTITNLASHFAWLSQGAQALAQALARPAGFCKSFDILSERLILGCGPDGMGLRSLRVQGLTRSYIQCLLREGFNTIQSIADADPQTLAKGIPQRIADEVIKEAQRALSQEGAFSQSSRKPTVRRARKVSENKVREAQRLEKAEISKTPPATLPELNQPEESGRSTGPSLLEVDMRGTGKAALCGQELDLTSTEFDLLKFLVMKPDAGASYEEIEGSVWADSQVERQQLTTHRINIITKMAKIIPKKEAESIFQLKRGKGMKINIEPERLRIIQ